MCAAERLAARPRAATMPPGQGPQAGRKRAHGWDPRQSLVGRAGVRLRASGRYRIDRDLLVRRFSQSGHGGSRHQPWRTVGRVGDHHVAHRSGVSDRRLAHRPLANATSNDSRRATVRIGGRRLCAHAGGAALPRLPDLRRGRLRRRGPKPDPLRRGDIAMVRSRARPRARVGHGGGRVGSGVDPPTRRVSDRSARLARSLSGARNRRDPPGLAAGRDIRARAAAAFRE